MTEKYQRCPWLKKICWWLIFILYECGRGGGGRCWWCGSGGRAMDFTY